MPLKNLSDRNSFRGRNTPASFISARWLRVGEHRSGHHRLKVLVTRYDAATMEYEEREGRGGGRHRSRNRRPVPRCRLLALAPISAPRPRIDRTLGTVGEHRRREGRRRHRPGGCGHCPQPRSRALRMQVWCARARARVIGAVSAPRARTPLFSNRSQFDTS